MNEILGIKVVQLYSSYVNDITDMHVIMHPRPPGRHIGIDG